MPQLSAYVPIISKSEFDNEAHAFLLKYYPDALKQPIAVPIEKIATDKMHLTIREERLTEDLSILGQMCFTRGRVEIYDKVEDEYREIIVEAGTMIIDPDTYYKRNMGSKRNTIAHECVHWEKHRLYHLMAEKLYGENYPAHRCPVNSKDEKLMQVWTDEDWMEWQANGHQQYVLSKSLDILRTSDPEKVQQLLLEQGYHLDAICDSGKMTSTYSIFNENRDKLFFDYVYDSILAKYIADEIPMNVDIIRKEQYELPLVKKTSSQTFVRLSPWNCQADRSPAWNENSGPIPIREVDAKRIDDLKAVFSFSGK